MYVSHDVPYTAAESSWDQTRTQEIFVDKWVPDILPNTKLQDNIIKRRLPEISHNYDFGPSISTKFLSWEYTKVGPTKSRKYVRPPKQPKEVI